MKVTLILNMIAKMKHIVKNNRRKFYNKLLFTSYYWVVLSPFLVVFWPTVEFLFWKEAVYFPFPPPTLGRAICKNIVRPKRDQPPFRRVSKAPRYCYRFLIPPHSHLKHQNLINLCNCVHHFNGIKIINLYIASSTKIRRMLGLDLLSKNAYVKIRYYLIRWRFLWIAKFIILTFSDSWSGWKFFLWTNSSKGLELSCGTWKGRIRRLHRIERSQTCRFQGGRFWAA